MRLASLLVLFVVNFTANGINFTSAEDAALANIPTSVTKLLHDAIEAHRLRRRSKGAKKQGEERMAGVNPAAALNVLNNGRQHGHVTAAVVSASTPLAKGDEVIATLVALVLNAGLSVAGAVGAYALYKKTLALDSPGA
jgi:hypothetical protein